MLAENLFYKIGFNEEEIREYEKYKNIIKDSFEVLARETVTDNITVAGSCEKARKIATQLNEYTADLMFLLECTGYLLQKYRDSKMRECIKVKKVFGTFVAGWYDGFFKFKRFSFGRLQFDITRHEGDTIRIADRVIEKGDLVLYCHIPSAGPLVHEQCIESYKKAYEYFKNELKDGVLVVRCCSWLLMPNYMEMFKKCSPNIYNFAKDFNILKVNICDDFESGWRIFGVEVDLKNIKNLPKDTKLQRGFVEYINNGGKIGGGDGILFFDGENVV